MNDEFTSNNFQNSDSNRNIKSCDYKNLITKLKDIKKTIALLEKEYSDKF
jgi:hypothetical protein